MCIGPILATLVVAKDNLFLKGGRHLLELDTYLLEFLLVDLSARLIHG